MAKNKSFNKLVAGTMTAAMVAGVVAPVAASAAENTFKDVPAGHWSEKAINDMAAKKIIAGQGDGTFGFGQNVTRAQVATFMVKAKGLEITSDAPSFSDVAGSMYEKFIATAEKNKVMAGLGNGKFGPEQELTRAQMAQILVNAYGFKADENNKKTFNDIDGLGWATAKSSIETLASLNIVSGKGDGKFDPNATVTREEAAQFIYNAMNYVPASTEVKAESVSATNSTTLTIAGTNLNKLTKDDITVANNTVSSVTPAADGKTATVTLKDELVVDQTTKVTVKGADFDVTYKVEASTAAVDVATYDDDTANQFVSIRVDGKKVTAQELINAGYTVSFDAFDKKDAKTSIKSDLLKSDATGELNTNLASKFTIPTSGLDVYVKVTLTKGSEVITSDLAKVTIKNLDLAADGITSARLVNYGTDGHDGTWANDFYQNSSTLVTGETAAFDQLKVKAGSDVNEVTSGFTVKSSDDSVVSVNQAGVLTAQGPGTATITVTYGGATYTKAITVKNGKREATTVSTSANAVSLSSKATKTISVNLLDQYGDPMVIKGGNVTLEQSNPTVVGAVLTDSTDQSGEADLTFTGNDKGAGTSLVTFRNAAGVKIGSTTVKATVTANDTLAQYSLTADDDITDTDLANINAAVSSTTVTKEQVSTDATLDLQADKYLKINLKGLNADGVAVSNPQTKAAEYDVKVDASAPGVLTAAQVHAADGYLVVEAGTKAGTATITVTNKADSKIVKTFKVTVENVGYNATGATLKNVEVPTYAKTLTYKDFLTYKEGGQDPVISGITLSKAVSQPVRLDVTGNATNAAGVNATNGSLYIDKDANGKFDNDDVLVGSAVMTTTGTIAGAPATDVVTGVAVASGDNGTVLFKVVDKAGNVVATKGVKVDF
ncbi:S-layer homology domain-containing protein [Bacillus sp. S14(2024)]|uniref:S-layer homology domain-containing protein n=1 Tax=Bacillus sp. S14(2024) TaxID=3162884 RepID=UPI003D1B4C2D